MTDAAGKAQGLAIDDLVFSASAAQSPLQPQLSIRLEATNAVLSWPTTFSGYSLQASPDLGQPAAWAAVSQTIMVTNGLNTVTVPAALTNQFYRLRK
jgi:hypothetical protein